MNTNTLATTSQYAPIPVSDIEKMANAITRSGLFGIRSQEQAVALMLIAQAEGKHPASVAAEYDIIQNRPALKSHAALARFQQAGGKIQWTSRTDDKASAKFNHPAGGEVEIIWTMERAKAAGLTGKSNWKTYPAQMLSCRVVAEGVRAVFPACLNGTYLVEEVQDFSDTKPFSRVIALEEPESEVITAEIVMGDISEGTRHPETTTELPSTPLQMLQSMMWSDEIHDAHVLHFLIAKKMPKVTKQTLLADLDDKVIERLIAKWDDVKAFKPAL
jgi:hypothetical protein